MILEFSVKNFRSIKDLQTISFVPTGLKSPDPITDSNNIVTFQNDVSVLKTVGIYGANASGKSNIIKAMNRFVEAIRYTSSQPNYIAQLCEPNIYNEDKSEGSFFQMMIFLNGKKYRYGFVTKKGSDYRPENKDNLSSSPYVVESEWLYGTVEKNMKCLFLRKGIDVENNSLSSMKDPIPMRLPFAHTLFLSYAAAFDSQGIANEILSSFSQYYCNDNQGSSVFRFFSTTFVRQKNLKSDLLRLLSSFGLYYDDIDLTGNEEDDKKLDYPLDKIVMIKHLKMGGDVHLNLANQESSGTQKLFDLMGILLFSFLRVTSQSVISLDEIDDKFHPSLLIKLVSMFNDKKVNKGNAQLIFTSHDTNLLSPKIMRRDQFYFTEKQLDETTRLFSLADLKGIRNDADFAKQYLAGFYGASPILSKYSTMGESNDGK